MKFVYKLIKITFCVLVGEYSCFKVIENIP